MSFDVGGTGPVLLSLPAWTPGAYEISNFARWVVSFSPVSAGQPIRWDKLDYDTWRLQPAAEPFAVGALRLHRGYAGQRDGLGPAGFRAIQRHQSAAVPRGSRLRLSGHSHGQDPAQLDGGHGNEAGPGAAVVPGEQLSRPGGYAVLCRPMDYDSMQVSGHWTRLATYPSRVLPAEFAGSSSGADRQDDSGRVGGVPGDAVEQLQHHDDLRSGIRRRERVGTSELPCGHLQPGLIGNPLLASITAHEIFHAWNVKRLRPAEMVSKTNVEVGYT